ncbi:MAG: sigma-54-dependent Fis family transcriptional regulator [Myxococcales bacterium]|nr:sigma-54-dependent Fis family transcriptional regulator [Myxococcales bacterium]
MGAARQRGRDADLRRQIAKVAPTRSRVLITGESGTGKELIARAIHRNGSVSAGPFVKVNCAAIPPELIESELFGHERGAFTGAIAKKRGLFEVADGGTIFLDEIGDMAHSAQAKVLRVLQTGEFTRVGGEKSLRTDCRVVAATNRDLEQMVKDGQFREDLYFRLNVVPIRSPDLKDRREDVPLLVESFVRECCDENGLGCKAGGRARARASEAVRLAGQRPRAAQRGRAARDRVGRGDPREGPPPYLGGPRPPSAQRTSGAPDRHRSPDVTPARASRVPRGGGVRIYPVSAWPSSSGISRAPHRRLASNAPTCTRNCVLSAFTAERAPEDQTMNKLGLVVICVAAIAVRRQEEGGRRRRGQASDVAAVNALVPASLKDKVTFEKREIVEKRGRSKTTYTVAAPKGWKQEMDSFANLKPDKDMGFMTKFDVGSNCDGECVSRDWAATVEKVYASYLKGKVIMTSRARRAARSSPRVET